MQGFAGAPGLGTGNPGGTSGATGADGQPGRNGPPLKFVAALSSASTEFVVDTAMDD